MFLEVSAARLLACTFLPRTASRGTVEKGCQGVSNVFLRIDNCSHFTASTPNRRGLQGFGLLSHLALSFSGLWTPASLRDSRPHSSTLVYNNNHTSDCKSSASHRIRQVYQSLNHGFHQPTNLLITHFFVLTARDFHHSSPSQHSLPWHTETPHARLTHQVGLHTQKASLLDAPPHPLIVESDNNRYLQLRTI